MKRILCVIDYQVDFVTGSMGSEAADAIAPALESRIREYLLRGDLVCFTRDMHEVDDYRNTCEGKHIFTLHCVKGTPGCEIDPRIRGLAAGCKIIDKPGFGSMELADWIASENPDEIELAGVATNICVLSNAVMVRTSAPYARVFIDRNCVASYDDELGEKSLDVMKSICVEIL